MSSFTIRRAIALPALMIAALALAASPLASQAAAKKTATVSPSVATGQVRVVGATTTLTGTIDPHGLSTKYFFEFGPGGLHGGPPTTYASHTTPVELHAVSVKENVSQTVTGLALEDHYRLVVTYEQNGQTVTKTGKDRVFAPTTKHAKSVFRLPSSFQPTLFGGTFVLSGTLEGAGNVGRLIELQSSPYPYSGPFVRFSGPIATGAGGAFSFRVADFRDSTRFRVATVGAPVVFSESFTQLAEVRVTLRAQTSHHVKGLVRLFGTVSPAAVGAHVFLQLEVPPKAKLPRAEKLEKTTRSEEREKPPAFTTKFTTVVKRATRSVSRFSVVATVKNTGNYRAFVQLPPGPVASGQSETVLLHAAPKKKRKK